MLWVCDIKTTLMLLLNQPQSIKLTYDNTLHVTDLSKHPDMHIYNKRHLCFETQ